MRVGPIVLRELAGALHQQGLARARLWIAAGASAATAVLLLVDWLGVSLLQYLGTLLYLALAAMALLLPVRLGLGLILDERSSGTLDLLFLAGVRPGEFFLSKAVGVLLIAANFLLGLVPFLALPFLAGGLSFETFLGMLVSLPVLLLASVGLTLLVSTAARDEAGAFALLLALGGTWAAGLPAVYWMGKVVGGTPTFSEAWLGLTPLYPLILLTDGLNASTSALLWQALGGLLAISLGLFGVAATLLPSVWRREQAAHRHDASSPGKPAVAADWGENPVETLITRNRRRLRLPYALLAGFVGCWTAGALQWGKAWVASSVTLAVMLLLLVAASSLAPFLLISQVARSRREGTTSELLLTPLSAAQIADGWVEGYARLVRPWRRVVALVSTGLFLLALSGRTWNIGALVSYLVIGGVLLWWTQRDDGRGLYAGFRLAFFTGNSFLAHLRGSGMWGWVLVLNGFHYYRLFQYLRNLGRPPEFPTGTALELTFVILGAFLLCCLAWAFAEARQNVVRDLAVSELRGLAVEPLPSRADPRLKRWRPDQPLLSPQD